MVHEYSDRREDEIYRDINEKFDAIKDNFNRDDEDAYQAAISVIVRYIGEVRAEYKTHGQHVTTEGENIALEPYRDLWDQLEREHDALEANGTRHYLWSQEAPHMQKLASRINNAERESLLSLNLMDAKYELVHGKMVGTIPVPGDSHHSYIETPPILTEAANGKTFTDVLADIKSAKPDLTEGMTYTLDFSECGNFDASRETITVSEDGLDGNGNPVLVNEGVKIYSTAFKNALNEYNTFKGYAKYNAPGFLDNESDRLKGLLTSNLKNLEKYTGFDKLLNDAEKIPEFKDAVKTLFNNKKLFAAFQSEFNNGNRNLIIEFLHASEAKLDHIISKAKQLGRRLCESPVDTHNPGIIQANFVGENGPVREYMFRNGEDGRQGQLCKISKKLYDFLDDNDGALKAYLGKRIRDRRNNPNYEKMELNDRVVSNEGTKVIDEIDKESYSKKYKARVHGIQNLTQLCRDFAYTYGDSDDYQPAQLVKLDKYLNNLLREVNKLYDNRKWIDDKQWGKIVTEIQNLWLDFKDHDGKRASMQDKTACQYINIILNSLNNDNIDIYTKKLGNGMTICDNTTGEFAVDNLVQSNKASGNNYLELKDEKKDKEGHTLDWYRRRINNNFNVKIDEDKQGNLKISNNTATDNLFNARKADETIQSTEGILKYLKKNDYLPEYADLGNDKIKEACENISEGMKSKMELLDNKTRRLEGKKSRDKMKEIMREEQEKIRRRQNVSKEELLTADFYNVLINDDNEIDKLMESQNQKMELNIKYGDMQAMMGDSFDAYFIKEGGGVKLRSGSGDRGELADVINDRYGTGGILDFSDENVEATANVLGQVAIEVAICAVAIAAGAVTAGAGSAAVLAARGALLGTRIARIVGGLRRVKLIASLCKRTSTGARYLRNLASAWKKSKYCKFLRVGTQAAAESRPYVPLISEVCEGVGFHVSNTMIHNAIAGKPIVSGLDNMRGYVESIAFLSVLKFAGANIAGLRNLAGAKSFMAGKAATSGLSKFFVKAGGAGISITGEMLGLGVTNEVLSLAFDHELKNIFTVQEFTHSLGMVLGLRFVRSYGGKAKNYIVKKFDKKTKTVTIEAEGVGTFEIKMDSNGKIVGKPKLIEKSKKGADSGNKPESNGGDKPNDVTVDNTGYFEGKSTKYGITKEQACSNSETMDKVLEEINEQNKSEKLEALRKEITEQYKKTTGKDLKLTEEQLLSILDAHEEDGILGQLTRTQLKQKVKILDETIKDPEIRRFLLESGFCGKMSDRFKNFTPENHEQYFEYGTRVWIPAFDPKTNTYDIVAGEVIGFDGKSGKYTFRRYDAQKEQYLKLTLTEDQFVGLEVPYSPLQEFWIPRKSGNLSAGKLWSYNPQTKQYKFERFDSEHNGYAQKGVTESELNIIEPNYHTSEEVLMEFSNGERITVNVTDYNPNTGEYTVTGIYNATRYYRKVNESSLDAWNGRAETTKYQLQDPEGNRYEAKIINDDKVNQKYTIERTDEFGFTQRKTLTYEEFNTELQEHINWFNSAIENSDNSVQLDDVVVVSSALTEKTLKKLRNNIDKRDNNTRAYHEAFGDPKHVIRVGEQTFYTTDCFVNRQSGRKYIIGYVDTPQGTQVRLFYRSLSEGARRSCPGSMRGHYSKGELIKNGSYETTTRPGREMQNELDGIKEVDISETGTNRDPITGIIEDPYFLGNAMAQEMNVTKLFGGENNTVDYIKNMNSVGDAKNFYANLGYEFDISGMRIVEGGLYRYEHNTLGTIEVQVCSVNLRGKEYHISFGRAINDPLNQVRVEEVTDPLAKTNSFGLPDKSVNAAPLTGKPIDYIAQVPREMRTRTPIDERREQRDDGTYELVEEGSYIDIREIYQDNPLIKQFKELSGIGKKESLRSNKYDINANEFEIPLKNGKCEYTSIKTGEPAEGITPQQAKECFFNGLDVTAQLMEGQSQRSVLSSGSLFLNNPEFMKLGGDIDVATDVQTFRNVALEKGPSGKTKLDQFLAEGKIRDLIFTRIDHSQLTIEGDTAKWKDKGGQERSATVEELIAKGDIRVEFNIPSKDGFMINCEFFPEPEGYGLIQLGTTRTEGKVNTYTVNGREVKTVNEELAAMSYMINLAHEFKNNTFDARKKAIDKGKPIPKLKDSVRINNFLQYLSSIGLETPNDIIEFIDKTKSNYEKQKGAEFTITENGETKTIDMSQYLKDGLDNLGELREILVKVESEYRTILKTEIDSRGRETSISFNQFMSDTYDIKQGRFNGKITYEQATVEIERLKTKIDISNPKNFAYYYEIYQLQNFIKP